MLFLLSLFLGMFFSFGSFLGFETQERQGKKHPKKERKTVSSTISMGKKGKPEVGDEDGKVFRKNPEEMWPYFFRILFNSFPN